MANVVETESFDEGVYRYEFGDIASGGEDGTMAKPIKNLANRTNWLKAQIVAIFATLSGLKSASTKVANAVKTAGDVPVWEAVYSQQEVNDLFNTRGHTQAIGATLITGSGTGVGVKANMTGMTVTFTPKGSKVLVSFNAAIYSDITTQGFQIFITKDGSTVRTHKLTMYQLNYPVSLQEMMNVTPNTSTTISIQWQANSNFTQNGVETARILTVLDLV